MLLEFVPAEDHQPLGVILLEHGLDKLVPERPGPACDENHLFRPIHPILISIQTTAPQTIVQPSPASGEAQPPEGLYGGATRADLKLRGDMQDRVVQVVSLSTLNFLHIATDKDSYSSSDIRPAMESLSAIVRSSS